MARPTEGWKLFRKRGVWHVRFTIRGRRIERTTGERDQVRAAEVAARIYAHAVRHGVEHGSKVAPGAALTTEADKWLTECAPLLDEETAATYALYARTHWAPAFGTVSGITRSSVERYRSERLTKVSASTVRKELSALRGFLRWVGSEVPVPGVPKRATGVRVQSRWRGTQEVSPEEADRILALLEEPARSRYILGYETSLRRSTLDALSVPEHWRRGWKYLRVPSEIDKARAGRPIPLTERAKKALATAAPPSGLIWGKRRFYAELKAAARKVLGAERGKRFVPMDLRATCITGLIERPGGNLMAAQYMAGHKHLSTTSRYAKASLRAAETTLGLRVAR